MIAALCSSMPVLIVGKLNANLQVTFQGTVRNPLFEL